MSREASAPVLLALGLAMVMAPCPTGGGGQVVHAGEQRAAAPAELAAVTVDREIAPVFRRPLGDGAAELELLLAQNTAPDAPAERGETVLAGFPMSQPESVEEEVAKVHKLEIVRRFTIQSLARRIVIFRLEEGRSAADLVAALKKDARVVSAQVNALYGQPPAQTEARGGGPPPPAAVPEPVQKRAAAPAPKSPAPPPHSKAAARAPTGRAAATAKPAAQTMRRAEGQASLVATKQAALRWPTADEPFVNVGAANK